MNNKYPIINNTQDNWCIIKLIPKQFSSATYRFNDLYIIFVNNCVHILLIIYFLYLSYLAYASIINSKQNIIIIKKL